jgi:hypothetical protein
LEAACPLSSARAPARETGRIGERPILFPILAIFVRLLSGGRAVALPDLFDERFLQMIF